MNRRALIISPADNVANLIGPGDEGVRVVEEAEDHESAEQELAEQEAGGEAGDDGRTAGERPAPCSVLLPSLHGVLLAAVRPPESAVKLPQRQLPPRRNLGRP